MWGHLSQRSPGTAAIPIPSLKLNHIALTSRCAIRRLQSELERGGDASASAACYSWGRQSPPHSCSFPLANPMRARDQWASTLPLAAAESLLWGDGAAQHGLKRPSGDSVKPSCSLALIFVSYNRKKKKKRWGKGQDQKQENNIFLHHVRNFLM